MNVRFAIPAIIAGAVIVAVLQPHAGAAVKKPVALQYDEIVRMAMGQQTPPPPGSFQADYATIMGGGTPPAAAAVATPTPTPAPRRHGGLFGALTQVVTGQPITMGGDQNGDQSDDSAAGNSLLASAMAKIGVFKNGTLVRHTFYKNWERTDDPVARTATISKCDRHEFISLDYKARTYRIDNTAPKCTTQQQMPAQAGPGRTVVDNQEPGTADITITNTATNLGPKVLDGIPTVGWNKALGYATTNATGSCKDGSMKILTESYVSRIVPPRRYCPLPRAVDIPTSPDRYVVHGGCKPRMHGAFAGVGGASDRLEMYLKMQMAAGSSSDQGMQFATVTERGNVKWLEGAAADALFSVPPGFTKQQ